MIIADFHIDYLNSSVEVGNSLIEKIFRLDQEFFPTPWSRNSWENLFSEPRVLAVLSRGDEIIGYSLFNLSTHDHFAHLLKIIIVPSFRSFGLGKYLLGEAIAYLEINHGIQNYFLEVEESNLGAISTYGAIGFKQIHIKKDFYGKNKSALIMTLSF